VPYDDPDPTDPMTLNGVCVETDDPRSAREMAECFVDELMRLGFGRERIVQVFSSGEFAGPRLAWRQLGEAAVREVIDEVERRWGGRQGRTMIDVEPGGSIRLPVMQH
jgi:hypothetical protein